MIILLFFALLAGFITVLSPCILPVLPILLSAGAGTDTGYSRFFGIVLGLIISFSFFTLTLTSIVHATGLSPDILRYGAIMLISFFGLSMIFPQLEQRFAAMTSGIVRVGSTVQEQSSHAGTGMLSGFILGVALGLLWTPCAGSILAAIVTLVATHGVTLDAVFVTLAYSIGAAIPMGFITYGSARIINSTQAIAGYSEIIRKGFGVLMILGAAAIALHFDVVLLQIMVKFFPTISIEHSEQVRNALNKLQPNSTNNLSSQAPDFVGISAWINSPALSLQKLRGKVVLIDFWTYSCINCIRTLPYLKKWFATYKDKGFIIIGVHTPEFEFEKSLQNVSKAIKSFGIEYPIALDSEYLTWRTYDNHYWPAHYLIDQQGIIQEKHFGEGGYQETENAIRRLLSLEPLAGQAQARKQVTPEIYLGYERAQHYNPGIILEKNQITDYAYTTALGNDRVGLKGLWLADGQYIQAQSNQSILDLNFIANHVHLVMASETPQLVTILLDDKPLSAEYYTADMNEHGQVLVHEPRKYDVVDLKGNYSSHKLTLQFAEGVSAYAFTFGD